MKILSLNGAWKLKDFDPGEGLRKKAHLPDHRDSDWIEGRVPGDVHTSLLSAGRIDDPFYGMNVEKCQWVEGREWWYRKRVNVPRELKGRKVELVFGGLDTYATIWVNGEKLGESQNMFVPASFDVTKNLRFGGENVVAVKFDSTVKRLEQRDLSKFWGAFYAPRVYARKAQMNFGWDWGPRLVTVGIWRDVSLRSYGPIRIVDVFARTEDLRDGVARVAVDVEVERIGKAPRELIVEVALRHGKKSFRKQVAMDGNSAKFEIYIKDPALWWPNGVGEPNLYDLRVRAFSQDGGIEEECSTKIGVRTIEVRQRQDRVEGGKHFTFYVNGVPVFARGADWIPADSFMGSVAEGRYRDWLSLAKEANMNMLRVWGGGIYEDKNFYRLCDEMGIMIWQDFMFACAAYPDFDGDFMDEVEREARWIVRSLRNHPCIALWCGNNENDWIDDMIHWNQEDATFYGERIYHSLLPRICGELDPTRFYWPSSPYGGDDHNSEREGDRHNWQVWGGQVYPRRFGTEPKSDISPDGITYKHYAEDTGRFISEFGIHASPVLETLRRNIPDEELRYGSPQMEYRNKDPRKEKKDLIMQAHTGLPKDIEQYIDFSMMVQAEGLRYGIEHYRRRKFHCSGALLWQLNDCWPGISWSVVDYYRIPKAGYYSVRRAFSPIALSFKDGKETISLWGVNDTLEEYRGRVELSHGNFAGKVMWREEMDVVIPANSSVEIRSIPLSEIHIEDRGVEYIYARPLSGDALFDARHFFEEFKDQRFPEAHLACSARSSEGNGEYLEVELSVATDNFARFVRVVSPVEGVRMSDNYFDLPPGSEAKVRLRVPQRSFEGEVVVRAINSAPVRVRVS
ncbi:MAG: beta-mannosidase [bacterium]